MSRVDPYSTEVRYMLDYMGFLLHEKQPSSVRIYSDSEEMVKACIRRMAHDGYRILVASEELRRAVREALGVEVEVAGLEPADAAFIPGSFDGYETSREAVIVGAVQNAVSYKGLRHPGRLRTTAAGAVARARRQYAVDRIVGMYPPRFLALLGLAQVAGRRSRAAYFRLGDLAMQHIFDTGPMWRLSYVVLFAGRR